MPIHFPIHFLGDGTSIAQKKLDDLDLHKATGQNCTDFTSELKYTDYSDAQDIVSVSFTSKGKKNVLLI